MKKVFTLAFLASVGFAPDVALASPAIECAKLAETVVAADQISLPTKGAVVTRARAITAGSGTTATNFCLITGEIAPVDPKAANIRFEIALPQSWNSKVLMLGGGGFNGIIPNVSGQLGHALPENVAPLSRGYAVFGSDSGHQNQTPALGTSLPNQDTAFFGIDEARQNYMADALKKTRDTALTIISAAYGRSPTKAYFIGGSKGGNEALTVTGRWPSDWDGVIAYYPVRSYTLYMLSGLSIRQAFAAPGAYPSLAKRRVLHDAALETCDGLDGVKDGLISNIAACRANFDPATALLHGKPVRCRGGADSGDTCLSDVQIAALKKIESPVTFPFLPKGHNSFPGFDMAFVGLGNSGSSALEARTSMQMIGITQPKFPLAEGNGAYFVGTDYFFRFAVANDNAFNSLAMNLSEPGPLTTRLQELAALDRKNETDADEDLSPFEARGGKLIIIQGTEDLMVSSRATAAYYEKLRATMGAEKVDRSVRFYEVPGWGHGVSTIFNAKGDDLSALEDWVEKGQDPADSRTVTDIAGVPGRTRPLCRYPSWPQYRGSGDVNAAASFKCVTGVGG